MCNQSVFSYMRQIIQIFAYSGKKEWVFKSLRYYWSWGWGGEEGGGDQGRYNYKGNCLVYPAYLRAYLGCVEIFLSFLSVFL